MHRLLRHSLPLILLASILYAGSAPAAKTDVVELVNGDRITGEIESLDRGMLQFSTDHIGTIDIEWTKVATLTTRQILDIELISGERLFGQLARPDEPGVLVVLSRDAAAGEPIRIAETVRIATITESGRLRQRLDGNLDLGYSYTNANDVSQLNVSANLSYRDRVRLWSLALSTVQSSSSGSDSSESSTLKASQRRFFGDRWYWSGLLQFDRNDSLGLDLRMLFGGGLGRYVVQTNARQVIAFAGLGLSNEQFTNADDVESVELMFGAGYDAFRFDDPQLDLHSALMLFPSLTVSGRIRAQAEISLSYELIKDFYFKLGFSGTYDSEPQSVGAERDDYSVTTSIGYKF